MARHRMLPVINSRKHYVQTFATSIGSAATVNVQIVHAVVASSVSDPTEVLEGSVVKAIYVELWAIGNGTEGVSSFFNVNVEKVTSGGTPMTNAQALALMTYPSKKNILYTTQGVLGSDIGAPAIPLMRQWIAIPKGKQRFGLGDKFFINISNVGTVAYQVCGVYVYKEYN